MQGIFVRCILVIITTLNKMKVNKVIRNFTMTIIILISRVQNVVLN